MQEKAKDDYEWSEEYPTYHYWQTGDIINRQGLDFELKPGFKIVNGALTNHNLHCNQVLLYETIWKWAPTSVFEVGCGYCNHLVSIKRMIPNIKVSGCDISEAQLDFAKIRYSGVMDFNVTCCDFLDYKENEKFDVVFSNAVLMHMSTDRAKRSIAKMLRMANMAVFILDGKLAIPNLEEYIHDLGYRCNMATEFAEANWEEYYYPPFSVWVEDK